MRRNCCSCVGAAHSGAMAVLEARGHTQRVSFSSTNERVIIGHQTWTHLGCDMRFLHLSTVNIFRL